MCCELQKQYSNRNESLCSISAVFLHMFTTPTDKYTYIHTYIRTLWLLTSFQAPSPNSILQEKQCSDSY